MAEKFNAKPLNETLLRNLEVVRQLIMVEGDIDVRQAWIEIESYCAVAMRVMSKARPSVVKDAARAVEIQAYIARPDT